MEFCQHQPVEAGYYWWKRVPEEKADVLRFFGPDFPYVMIFESAEAVPLTELLDFNPSIQFAGPFFPPEDRAT